MVREQICFAYINYLAVSNYPLPASPANGPTLEMALGSDKEAMTRVRCYNCGQIGHLSYNCQSPQVRKACYTCGNQGHLSRDW